MVGPDQVSPPRRSITRQAAQRLILSLGLFVALLGFTTYRLYVAAFEKSAHERTKDLATFYTSRLAQQETAWELQGMDFKVRLEVTRLLEKPATALSELQAFMTVQGTNRSFSYLLIQNAEGRKIFSFDTDADLERIPLGEGQATGWHINEKTGRLHRVFVVPIWLGEAGTGRMALFYPVDNALLHALAAPEIALTVLYKGKPTASSLGLAGLGAVPTEGSYRDIPWSSDPDETTTLRIASPPKPIFTTLELVGGVSTIPLLDALILWFGLGVWLMHNTARIRQLGLAVRAFATEPELTPTLRANLAAARGKHDDEIRDVADAIEDMANEAVRRKRERADEDARNRLWSMVFSNSGEAIVITDEKNAILAVNEAFTRLTGFEADEVIGKDPKILSARRESPEFYAEMWTRLANTNHWDGEVLDRRKDGSVYPKWLRIAVVRNPAGGITNFVGTFSDISERKEAEERFVYLANHDSLTGLPNRHLLLERLRNAIGLSSRDQRTIGLLFLDLDNFKWVNDSLGHASGDKLLCAISERLMGVVRSTDTVARLGGDEFVVMLLQVSGHEEIAQVAKKVIGAVAQPVDLNGYDFHVTTSIGIAVFPHDGNDPDILLKHADVAMYAAKNAGKNQYRYFDATMNDAALERIALEQDLRQAIQRGELELHYQAKLCLATSSICGAEALIRWRHPQKGLVPPLKFIPLAEELGLIIPIGEWVIRTACRQAVAWLNQGLPVRRIAVNLSALQLESDSFVEAVEAIVRETGVPTNLIEFELTESMVLRNPAHSVETLNDLRRLGIHLSLDDFGTGYSSLSYLKRLPIDSLKIDRSFIEGLPEDEEDAQIVRMIVALAKSIGLEVIAEGIETQAQMDHLREIGCDMAQGYLISKPIPAADYPTLIASSCDRCGKKEKCR